MSMRMKINVFCIVGLIALVGCAGNNEEQDPPQETAVSVQQSNETKVPQLEGETLNHAIRSIREANLTYDLTNNDFDVDKERNNTDQWVVEKQDKSAGSTVPVKDTVNLSLKRK